MNQMKYDISAFYFPNYHTGDRHNELWHGAGWTFIIWGALHGLGQIAERAWGPGRDRLPVWLRWSLTFAFVNLAWVFFRAPSLGGAWELLSAAVTGGLARPEAWLLEGVFSKETGINLEA